MAWFDTYRSYDDDTLTVLANAGLLRRAAKDVDAGKVAWIDQSASDGIVAVDEQRVQIDARGPQHARCDCSAPGLCKHILGATLWLRDHCASESTPTLPAVDPDVPGDVDSGDGTVSIGGAASSQSTDSDPLAEVLALSAAALFKAAGAAAVRRAAATPLHDIEVDVRGGVLVMTLPELGQSCRWIAGAGFAGMVSEVPAAERKAVHLIAIAALWRAHGRSFDWPEAARPTPVTADSGRLVQRERDFLVQVHGMLHELLQGGLSHVSELTSARLLALNMSARGEGLPRLAALLRNLGGTVDLLVRRDHRAEERDALSLMARSHALCTALDTAQGDLATALRGRLRRDFDEGLAVNLVPVGAHWWQTRGGARGLTLGLWDIDGARLLQATLARPDGSDTAFTRHHAWSTHALWPGAGSAQRVCDGTLRLEQPRLAEDGRLALGGVTRAYTAPPWSHSDPRLASLGCADWSEVEARLRAATGLAGEPLDAMLLRPTATLAPVLDETRQQLTWQLQDTAGRWITLVIPIAEAYRTRIDNLERATGRGAVVHAVLVRVERAGAQTLLIPVALLSNGSSAGSSKQDKDLLRPLSLDFANEPVRQTSLTNRILRIFEARRDRAAPVTVPSLTDRLLAPVFELLETQAATGRLQFSEAQAQRLDLAAHRLASVGLDTLSAALGKHLAGAVPSTVLSVYWLCQLVAELDGLSPTRA